MRALTFSTYSDDSTSIFAKLIVSVIVIFILNNAFILILKNIQNRVIDKIQL
jgi:hypothetical protein